jgi:Phage integrase, N-terminal SAM-like domain
LFYVAGRLGLTIGVFPLIRQEVAVKEEKTTPLRQRMIEDMRIRGLCAKTQQAHIRHVKHFAGFLGRSPDTATPDDLRAYQLDMSNAGVSASTFNVRIISLRFFFGMTCGQLSTFCIRFSRCEDRVSVAPAVRSDAAGVAVPARQGTDVHLYGRAA